MTQEDKNSAQDDHVWFDALNGKTDAGQWAQLRRTLQEAETADAAKEDVTQDWQRLQFALRAESAQKKKKFASPLRSLAVAASLLVFVCATYIAVMVHDTAPQVLFTEDEARQLRYDANEEIPRGPRMRSLSSTGPRVVISYPSIQTTAEVIETVSPATLTMHFDKQKADVDMATLQVRARKGVFSKTITDIFLPYIKGNQLAASNIEIPKGKFQIEVEISDVEGITTTETYQLSVK